MSASIKIEIYAGTSIDDASRDAQWVADSLRIRCEFRFNDVKCVAVPGGNAARLAERQQREQSRKLTGPLDWRSASSKISLSASPHNGEAPITTAIEVGCGGKAE